MSKGVKNSRDGSPRTEVSRRNWDVFCHQGEGRVGKRGIVNGRVYDTEINLKREIGYLTFEVL